MPPLQLDLTSSFAAHANFMLCSSPCPAHRPWHARGGCLFQHLHPWLRGACMLGRPRGSSYVPWHATTTMGQALPVNLTINKAFHVAHSLGKSPFPVEGHVVMLNHRHCTFTVSEAGNTFLGGGHWARGVGYQEKESPG
eukprot:180155-Pelagomonas_calceolata.AAC.1